MLKLKLVKGLRSAIAAGDGEERREKGRHAHSWEEFSWTSAKWINTRLTKTKQNKTKKVNGRDVVELSEEKREGGGECEWERKSVWEKWKMERCREGIVCRASGSRSTEDI